MSTQLAKGQRWKEVDPRFNRVVEIVECEQGRSQVVVRRVESDGTLNKRRNYASVSRFNGKRGGYERAADDATSVNGTTTVRP